MNAYATVNSPVQRISFEGLARLKSNRTIPVGLAREHDRILQERRWTDWDTASQRLLWITSAMIRSEVCCVRERVEMSSEIHKTC